LVGDRRNRCRPVSVRIVSGDLGVYRLGHTLFGQLFRDRYAHWRVVLGLGNLSQQGLLGKAFRGNHAHVARPGSLGNV
jgi:hypothetical protein